MPGWQVVKFQDESIEVVPFMWIEKEDKFTVCFWPPYDKNRLINAIKNKQKIESSWVKHRVQILSTKIYTNFETANAKASKAQYTTDISSDSAKEISRKRVIRKPSRFHLETDDGEGSENEQNSSLVSMSERHTTNYPKPPYEEHATPFQIGTSASVVENSTCFRNISSPQTTKPVPATNVLSLPMQPINCSTPVLIVDNSSDYPNLSNTCTPVSSISTNDEFQRQVLRQLNLINTRLKDHSEYLHIIMEQQNATLQTQTLVEEVDCKFDIPLQSEEDLVSLEEILNNPDFIMKLAKSMAAVGGKDVKETVRRIMPRLMHDRVAKLYSYVGAKGKKKFSSLKINDVVKEAVKLNCLTKSATEKEVELVVSIWLSKANDRLKRKKEIN